MKPQQIGISVMACCLIAGSVVDGEEPAAGLVDVKIPVTATGPECRCNTKSSSPAFTRTEAAYDVPDVTLVRMDGRNVSLATELRHDGPVILQFFFSSCATLCPALSGSLAEAQKQLGPDAKKVRILSISIDPRHDRPRTLIAYARQFQAASNWQFYTGSSRDIAAAQKAFAAFQQNKMQHEPLTFIRPGPEVRWIRLNGLLSGQQLAGEFRLAVKEQD